MRTRLVLLFTAVIYSSFVIQWSFRHGRLAMDPLYDDIGYLLDAQHRISLFDTGGLRSLIASLWNEPPHSPWSTGLAMIGFIVFGVQAWAPYAMNAVLVLGLLLVANRFLPIRTNATRVAVLSVVLALPLTFNAIGEFRPDIAVGLVTAFGCLITIQSGLFEDSRNELGRSYLFAGMLFGLGFLIKPSFLYHTSGLMLLSFGLAELSRMLVRHEPLLLARRLIRLAIFLLGCVSVAGLYYFRAWRSVIEYISLNTGKGTDAKLWRIPGGLKGALKSYLVSGSAAQQLSIFVTLFLVTILAGLAFNAAGRRWRNLAFILSGLICAAGSLGVMVVGRVDNPFFGVTWQILLILLSIYSLGTLSGHRLASFACSFFLLGGLVLLYLHPPFQPLWHRPNDALASNSLNKAVVARIEEIARQRKDVQDLKVYACFAGSINCLSQNWVAAQEGLDFAFWDLHRSGSLRQHAQQIAAASIVEVASENAGFLFPALPSSPIQPELLNYMRQDGRFTELAPVQGQQGSVFLFARKELMPSLVTAGNNR